MSVKENKIMVNVGIPYPKLLWIDSTRGNTSRSEYLGQIVLPVIEKRMEEEKAIKIENTISIAKAV